MWFLLHILLYVAFIIAALAVLLELIYVNIRVNTKTRRNQTMSELEIPPIAIFYFCAFMQTFHMSPAVFYPTLPSDKLTPVDPDSPEGRQGVTAKFYPPRTEKVFTPQCYMRFRELEIYKKVIGFRGGPAEIPPIWMCSYFNKAIISLGSSEFSRVRILDNAGAGDSIHRLFSGMVHLSQQITVYQDLSPLLHGHFTVTFLNEEYRMTTRGLENTVRGCVWGRNDVLMWECVMTGISILPNHKKGKRVPPRKPDFHIYKQEEIKAPENIGMVFARATQDYQPQHISKRTAKLVGFNSPIAHGLWTMAVSVDKIMDNEQRSFKDKYPLHLEVHFKRPMIFPGTAYLQYDKPRDPSHLTNFRLVQPQNTIPILVGLMHTGESLQE
ncbi:hypothetical protein EGW08_018879 [Elysia chlorotica]|uniref:MaoC-like domain-containing protein n=1 Tax=Elysia chlorotica TaxID=188477 RepID=A0A433SVP1_ELYCH|nr:hypothetical protein EGW08_018879 [Elysia chlorotica]